MMDRVLIADEGMVYTNGNAFGKEVWLGVNDKAENWWTITEADAEEMQKENEVNADGNTQS